jgi:putative transposase
VAEARDEIAELMRRRDGKTVGSRAWKQLNRRVAKVSRQAKHRSDNWARQTARDLVERHGVIVLEDLKLTNMTRSARGTVDNPGRNVAAKQALNRQLQDAALGRLRHWTCVKAEEAGRRTWAVNPADTSRTCAACGHCDTANRVTRDRFRCQQCGHAAHADLNAAENIAARGRVCETTWATAGSPPLVRPRPRLQRRKAAAGPGLARAG